MTDADLVRFLDAQCGDARSCSSVPDEVSSRLSILKGHLQSRSPTEAPSGTARQLDDGRKDLA